MKQSRPGQSPAPRPEDLTAYVDGQLDASQRKAIETWLRDHPEAAAEIDGQRRLAELWQATTPPEPDDACWASMRARVACATDRFRAARGRSRRLLRVGAAGLAAGVLLVLSWPAHKEGANPSRREESALLSEPLAVVSPDDVEIVSLHAADRATLVVGVPPVTEPLVLASVHDVELEGVQPDSDGMVPSIHMDERSVTPMIVAPLDPAPAGTPENFQE